MACQSPSPPAQNPACFVEELGIRFGNGSLFNDRRWSKAGFDTYGNLYDDQPYLEFNVSKLIEAAYGIKPKSYVHPRSATLILKTLSRKALHAKEEVGLRPGRKTHLRLPDFLRARGRSEAIVPFLRGLVDIEGTLRFRKQFRGRHYYPVLECEMGDAPLIRKLCATLTKMGLPAHFRVKHARLDPQRRAKGSFYICGWNGINAWIEKFGFANAKHVSKLLVVEKHGYCPTHTSLDERLGIIAGELDPRSFYSQRAGDLLVIPNYRYAHELMTLRIASQPRVLSQLISQMKVRAKLTEDTISRLLRSRELQIRRTEIGNEVETTERGFVRLRTMFGAWKELESRYGIAIPDRPCYYPAAFRSQNVNWGFPNLESAPSAQGSGGSRICRV